MWRAGGKVVAGTFSPHPLPSACQEMLRVRPLPRVRLALLQPHLIPPLPPVASQLVSWRLSRRLSTPRSLHSDPPSLCADLPSLLPCSISSITLQMLSIMTCCLHLYVFNDLTDKHICFPYQLLILITCFYFQMCSKETREATGPDNVSTTVAAPARFDSKPTFRQSFVKTELVKWVQYKSLCGYWLFSKTWNIQQMWICFSMFDCSGDARRENRFVRVPPRLSSQPIRRPGDRPQRPAIINADDLKDLDDLDNDCEDGWAGQYFITLVPL